MGKVIRIVLLTWSLLYGSIALPRVDPLVESKVGLIKGLIASDGSYSMFLGIPYATVDPENPFGHSIPHSGFNGTFNAFEESAVCPQLEEFNETLTGSLECLYLNVYVPNTASSDNRLPVMVWIHGGGFQYGSGGRFSQGPKYLVQHDVILVTINYRLGPYGFMCLDTPEVPGNQGLKDQLTALRWVKNNIEAFGGDIKKITLFGESAGGTSVDYHFIYTDEDLFQNVIIQSGTALAPIALTQSDSTVPLRLAEYLGFTTDNIDKALEFLKTVETNLLIAATIELDLNLIPCLEKEFNNVERYVTDVPVKMDIPNAKNIPILIGFNSNEFGSWYGNMDSEELKNANPFNDIKQYFDFDSEYSKEMENTMRRFYLGDEDITEDVKADVIDFASDLNFLEATYRSIDQYIENGAKTIYHYMFSYDGARNFVKRRNNITFPGALHADEISYLFEFEPFDETPTNEDQLIIDRITTLWTNFAKFSNPVPETSDLLPVEWPVLTKDDVYCYNIDTEISVKKRPFHERMTFWNVFFRLNKQFLKGFQDN